MLKILHSARYTGTPWDILKDVIPNGFIVETLEKATYDCLRHQCIDANYLLVSGRLPIDEGVLSAAKHLKMIQRTGVGIEMLDLKAIKNHGIPVYVNSGVNARSVAEHTVTLMLACLKRLTLVNAQVHSGIWEKQENGVMTHELYGKKIGLVGMGNIGKQVASLLMAFGAQVFYTDIIRQPSNEEEYLHLTFIDHFEDLLPIVDILSFHCPLTNNNLEILNAKTLALIKPGAVVINTARGKLIDSYALYEAIQSGIVSAAGLDTHYEEPLRRDYPLLGLDNVILTPHIGGLSYEAFYSMMKGAIDNIVAFESGLLDQIESKRLKY